MVPALKPGDYILVSTWFRCISTGNMVVFKYPKSGMLLVKRISRINGEEYYVLGDNLPKSQDSREFGWIERRDIIGKVILRI